MSIKPIDLQTNIGQMHEVGRGEHARSGAGIEQQLVLDKEAAQKSALKNTRLDELKKGEKTEVRDALAGDREKKEEQARKEKEKNDASGEGSAKTRSTDDRMGKIIDVLK
jgi:aminopeptidase N